MDGMPDDLHSQTGIRDEEEAHALLRELEAQTSEQARAKRSHQRLAIKAKVVLQPGNSGELLKLKLQGVTGDISDTGCGAMFPIPLGVGDVYRLTFDRACVDLPLIFARCMHCQLVEEDAYSVGIMFFKTVHVAEAIVGEKADLLI
ncbi:hypothetical protein LCGC14_1896630 [marine sediment metagenome]|uniref:PilZ domain-containing protein n=1 Tax=marine sediment metagenome TaxID=412755 RepID=A0A0F9FXY5_9ZZZZ